MSELKGNNIIDARPLFKVRRESRVSTLDELEDILEAEELCEEVCMSITAVSYTQLTLPTKRIV